MPPTRNTPAPPAPEVPILQWANGKPMARPVEEPGRFSPLVGWHVEVGSAEFDSAALTAGLKRIEIKHQRQGGAEIVQHWHLGDSVKFYPVTSGPVATTVAGSMGRNTAATAEAGIGLRWADGERSKMALRGYLVLAGEVVLVQLSVRSRMTDELLKALLDHGRVCEAADHLVDRGRHPDVVTFHEIALSLGPGEEQEWGKGDTATVVPFISLHPQGKIDADYLRGTWRSSGIHAAALRDWESIQAWAQEYAAVPESGAGVLPPPDEEPGLFEEPVPERVAVIKAPPKPVGAGRARH